MSRSGDGGSGRTHDSSVRVVGPDVKDEVMPTRTRLPGTCEGGPRLHRINCALFRARRWRSPLGVLMRVAIMVLACGSIIAALALTT